MNKRNKTTEITIPNTPLEVRNNESDNESTSGSEIDTVTDKKVSNQKDGELAENISGLEPNIEGATHRIP